MKKAVMFLIFLAGFAVMAQAQTQSPGINHTQKRQVKRIGQGVKSGELTKKEARELARQQRRINRRKHQAKADGKLTRKERREIKARQRNASRKIWRKKHNAKDRN